MRNIAKDVVAAHAARTSSRAELIKITTFDSFGVGNNECMVKERFDARKEL